LKERIGEPKLIFCLDSGAIDYERLWITTALRGFSILTIRIDVLNEGVHSGSASGLVPSSFRILRSLLERLEDQETGRMVEGLDVDIPPNRYKELYDLAHEKGEEALKNFETVPGLQRVSQNVLQSLILNGWKAQLSVIGASGLPNPGQAGNVLLPYTETRLSIRLPPTKDPKQAEDFIIKTLT
jgi:acetylornithine deacetylase/succinyl-diaminopimelate desuccinylase-like protein